MDAMITANANPIQSAARMASIKIAAIVCALTAAQTAVMKKVKRAIAQIHAQTAATQPAQNVSVNQVVPMALHATPKQDDAPASTHVPMDAKMMARATKHAKQYIARAKMNNVRTVPA